MPRAYASCRHIGVMKAQYRPSRRGSGEAGSRVSILPTPPPPDQSAAHSLNAQFRTWGDLPTPARPRVHEGRRFCPLGDVWPSTTGPSTLRACVNIGFHSRPLPHSCPLPCPAISATAPAKHTPKLRSTTYHQPTAGTQAGTLRHSTGSGRIGDNTSAYLRCTK